MTQTRKFVAVFAITLSFVFLAACSSPTPTSAPTPDLDLVRTEAAATVFAQVTRDLALTPSPTPLPSPTLAPSPTLEPTEALGPTLEITTAVIAPTSGENRAEWVSQSIADDTVFAPGETFTMTWQLRNVGTSSWTAGYRLRFYSGETFGAPAEILLGQIVLPGDTVEITIQMRAPNNAGTYRTDWVMSTESLANFNEPVFLRIIVAVPLATSTIAPTSTP